MTKKKILTAIAIIVLVGVGIWLREFLTVDSCLDSGGRWNSDKRECEK